MIFDADKFRKVLRTRTNGSVDSTLHELTRPLIESIAARLDSTKFDDLTQDAHLKLQRLLNQNKINPDNFVYTFLSRALRNAMIDSLRKSPKKTVPLDLSYHTHEILAKESKDMSTEVYLQYMINRFPSIEDISSIECASLYTLQAILESINPSSIKNTLKSLYDYPAIQSKIFYQSVIIYHRSFTMECVKTDDALKFLSNYPYLEMTNVPDICLRVGYKETHKLLSSVFGFTIKF